MSVWQLKQRKLYQQIEQLSKELESVQNQKLALSLSTQKFRQEYITQQEFNKAMVDYIKRALINSQLLQDTILSIRQKCVDPNVSVKNADLLKQLLKLEVEVLALKNNLDDAIVEKNKGKGGTRR
ncbi:hypothetical protein RFI_10222 [Reticulomyxa filosa]|uniref:Uncharacterized protein n=1 Tax=Reticulomyxa filosa TaxID=46433 RepID=X6NML6_RETFI|nr:hypothetical protein RFI_10222 [Reticulomyxa filosa]|eukprot:ETO26919.1 hypothetical protein RFI_10222 [Reticulomyxa filosa]